MIDECKHSLVYSVPPETYFVDADPTRLVQVFMNLLNNAAKYMDTGGRIELSVRQMKDYVWVTVKDKGIGIAPDRLESVFEMFSQVDTALERSHGGLGIGLTLTQKLVEMHQGSIKAKSSGLGQGSEFVVRLPIATSRTGRKAKPMQTPQLDIAASQSSSMRILVADDNEDAADALEMLLCLVGHTVLKVNRGGAVLSAVKDFDPQLVLLDIGMPELNGYDVCQAVRKESGGRNRTIIAVTGWGQPSDLEKSRSAGFNHHLVEPVDPNALLSLIANLA